MFPRYFYTPIALFHLDATSAFHNIRDSGHNRDHHQLASYISSVRMTKTIKTPRRGWVHISLCRQPRVYIGLSPARLQPEGLLIGLSKNIWELAHKDFCSRQATRAIAPTLMVWISVFVYRNPIVKHRLCRCPHFCEVFAHVISLFSVWKSAK